MAKIASEKPWERQAKESVQAYEAFSLYLEMGAERSLRKVAQKLSKSDTLIKRWSSQWSWQSRSREYDADQRRIAYNARKKEIVGMQERQSQLGVLMQNKALKALKSLDFSELTPIELLKFLTEGAKLERLSRDNTKEAEEAAESASSSLADTIIAAYKKRTEGN